MSQKNEQAAVTLRPSYRLEKLLPGLFAAAAVAVLCVQIAQFPAVASRGISALTLAIALGMVLGNTVYGQFSERLAPGIGFSKQSILRLGIVLYGLRLTFQDIGQVGTLGIVVDLIMVCSTFLLANLLGSKVLGLDRTTSMLIGSGGAICGAAAVMATEPVVRARPEQVTVAVSTVVVFGTLGMFLYPILFDWNIEHGLLSLSEKQYGLLVGSTVHEVAQVVVAGRAVSEAAADTAVIAKMVRVMLLAPFLIALSAWVARGEAPQGANGSRQATSISIPWFAVGFIAVAGISSLNLIGRPTKELLLVVDTFLLTMAMGALGLTTHVSALRNAGLKPLLLAALLFVWLTVGGTAINLAFAALWKQ